MGCSNKSRDFSDLLGARCAVVVVAGALAALATLAGACGGEDPQDGTGGSGGGDTSASSGGGGNASATGSSSSGNSSTSGAGGVGGVGGGGAGGVGGAGGTAGAGGSGGAGPPADCGNNMVEAAEKCDDGNEADGDYCSADCTNVTGSCGDGVVQANETCDDGVINADCGTFHDGGDGKCLPAGACSPDYVIVMNECKPVLITDHVHIMPDNACNITINPTEYFVPAGQKLKLSYHNHSNQIPIKVWMHYNGGSDLQPGGIWNEQYEHCFGPIPSEGYAEITACNQTIVLPIHCL